MLPGAGLAASLRPVFVGFISLKTIPLFVMQRFASLVRYAWILALALGAFHVSSSPARAEKCGDATPPHPGGSLSSLPPGPPVAVGTIRDRVLTTDATPIVRFGVARYFADPNEDVLTYAAESRDPRVATAEICGSILKLVAKRNGNTMVTVTASDGTKNATQFLPMAFKSLVSIPFDSKPLTCRPGCTSSYSMQRGKRLRNPYFL